MSHEVPSGDSAEKPSKSSKRKPMESSDAMDSPDNPENQAEARKWQGKYGDKLEVDAMIGESPFRYIFHFNKDKLTVTRVNLTEQAEGKESAETTRSVTYRRMEEGQVYGIPEAKAVLHTYDLEIQAGVIIPQSERVELESNADNSTDELVQRQRTSERTDTKRDGVVAFVKVPLGATHGAHIKLVIPLVLERKSEDKRSQADRGVGSDAHTHKERTRTDTLEGGVGLGLEGAVPLGPVELGVGAGVIGTVGRSESRESSSTVDETADLSAEWDLPGVTYFDISPYAALSAKVPIVRKTEANTMGWNIFGAGIARKGLLEDTNGSISGIVGVGGEF